MKWKRAVLHKQSIKTMMYGSFLLLVMLPILSLGVLSYQSYKSIMIEQSTQRTLQTLKQVGVGIDREASQIVNTGRLVYKDMDLLALVDRIRGTDDEEKRQRDIQKAKGIINGYFHYTNDLISVIFFYSKGGTFSTDPSLVYDEKMLRSSLWYNKTLADEGRIKLFGVQQNSFGGSAEKFINTAAAAIPESWSDQTGVELIYLVYKGALFQNLFETNTKEYGSFLILDTEDKAIAANRETYIQSWLDQPSYLYQTSVASSGEYTEQIDGNETYITFFTAPNTRFKVIHLVPYSVLTAPMEKVFIRTVSIGITVMALFLLVSWMFARTITRPIRDLVQEMFKVKKGLLQSDFEPDGPSEVYMLGNRFKSMMREMDTLIHEREEQERAKALAELRALQSQINPHFMLNTLNAIKLMAVINKVPNIRDMTDAFIRLLSSTFNRGGMTHSVREEMDYLQSYFDIMKYRYGNYEVEWDMDPQMRERFMLKLLLQPIVENAITHGLQYKEGEGKLLIRGRLLEEKMVFSIEDNGVGMGPEEVGELMSAAPDPTGFSGMGIRNVHRRVRLHYGDGYGLNIVSREGEGTAVEVVLPGSVQQEYDENVSRRSLG